MSRSVLGSLCTAALVALAASADRAAADDYTVVPDQFVYCTTCHGVELQGNASVDAPRLNGMEEWYVRAQMNAFRAGWRGAHPEDLTGMEMRPQATVLSEDEVDQAAAFVASLPVRQPPEAGTVDGDAIRGKELYAACAACHGPEGRGSKVLGAPALAGQSDWYLVRQLDKYRKGIRGHDPADAAGQQMRASMSMLPDDAALEDVTAYINTLSNN
jgi:cytochrome c oxidase subunit 2